MPLHNWPRVTLCTYVTSLMFLLSLGCWGRADENDSRTKADQPVSVDEVIERLEQVEAKLHGFRVHCLSTVDRRNSSIRVVEELEEIFGDVSSSRTTTNVVWHYRDDGSWRFEADVVQVDATADAAKQTKKFSAYSVFDGPRGRGKYLTLNSPDSDVRVSKEEEQYGSTPKGFLQKRPTEFLTQSWRRSFTDELRQDQGKITRREILDGRALVVLTTKARKVRPNIPFYLYREFWIDVERGVVVRLQTFARESEDSQWGLQLRQESSGYEWDAGSELWLPTSAKELQWNLSADGKGKLFSLAVFAFSGWEINPEFAPETFLLEQSWYTPNDRP